MPAIYELDSSCSTLNARRSACELESLEVMQRLFDLALVRAGGARSDPVPLLHFQFLRRAVGFQIQGGDHLVPDQDGADEITQHPLVARHIGLEEMGVAEEKLQAFTLDDERIER